MAQSRAQKKLATYLRYKRRLEGRLADIDWEMDVLLPELEKLAELEAVDNVQVELGEGEDPDLS